MVAEIPKSSLMALCRFLCPSIHTRPKCSFHFHPAYELCPRSLIVVGLPTKKDHLNCSESHCCCEHFHSSCLHNEGHDGRDDEAHYRDRNEDPADRVPLKVQDEDRDCRDRRCK